MGNYGELWFNHGQLLGIMGQFSFIHGELWGNLENYGELWGIMGFYGELWGILLLLLVSILFLLCSFPTDMSDSNFHAFNNVLYVRLSYLYKPPREYLSQGHLARVMKKLGIKCVTNTEIGLAGAGGRRGGAWVSCTAALQVVPLGHRDTCAFDFAAAAAAAGVQGVDTAATFAAPLPTPTQEAVQPQGGSTEGAAVAASFAVAVPDAGSSTVAIPDAGSSTVAVPDAGLLAYAKSARVFDPRQREQLPKEIENYVTADKVQRVVPGNMAATLATEWELYWTLPAVPAQLDLMAWWRGMKSQLPQMATLAICTLSIPHTAADVERCNSFYKLTRTDKQHSLGDAHHLGRLSFAMNGIVPPPMGV